MGRSKNSNIEDFAKKTLGKLCLAVEQMAFLKRIEDAPGYSSFVSKNSLKIHLVSYFLAFLM